MSDCLQLIGNQFYNQHILDPQSQLLYPFLERASLYNFLLFMVKEHTTSGPGATRNDIMTFLLNCHNRVYLHDDYRICNGPYKLIAFDMTTGQMLDHAALGGLAQAIRDSMDQHIQQGLYQIGISATDGADIKVTMY